MKLDQTFVNEIKKEQLRKERYKKEILNREVDTLYVD